MIATLFYSGLLWAQYDTSCINNEGTWKRNLRVQLNQLNSSNADRADDVRWPQYCACWDEVSKTIPKGDHRNELDVVAKCVAKAGFKPRQPAPAKMALTESQYFADQERACVARPMAEVTKIEVLLKVRKDPRANRVRSLDIAKYCACYYKTLRHELGDSLAERATAFVEKEPFSAEQLLRVNGVKDKSIEVCAAEQLPFTGESAEKDPFQEVFSGMVTVGKGIGPLEIGITRERLTQILGPTNVVVPRKDHDEHKYGPNLMELEIQTAPPGRSGKVQRIFIDRTFRGKTNNGIGMGETMESVEKKMLPEKPAFEERNAGVLVYASGTQFGFGGSSPKTLRSITLFAPGTHRLLKAFGRSK